MDISIYEKVISHLAGTYAQEHHSARFFSSLTEQDRVRGVVAASLELFDLLTTHCCSHGCYHLSETSMSYIDELSVDECLRLKAYHIWKDDGTPYPTSDEERVKYYCDAHESVLSWCKRTCCGKEKIAFALTNEKLTQCRPQLLEKKGYWSHIADPGRSWEMNSAHASSYLDVLAKAFTGKITSDQIAEMVGKYKEVMSVYELTALVCHSRTPQLKEP